MLIDIDTVKKLLVDYNINVKGVLHIGAHNCEELPFYTETLSITPDKCIWIDAIQPQVDKVTRRGIPNVYQAVITDKDNDVVIFNISNNIQSSSILPLGTHKIHHDWVHYTHKLPLKTTTVDTFFKKHNLNAEKYDFWNFDIQGAELLALKGAIDSIKYAKAIYLEVNTEEVYKGCGLINEIDKFLFEYKFMRIETKMTNAGWGDALYIKMLN